MSYAVQAKTHELALSLIQRRDTVLSAPEDSPRLIAFFRENKYPILGVRPTSDMGEAWRSEVAQAELSYREQRDEYLQVRNAWLESGIACIAFKSAGIAPSFPYTSDNLDILVHRAHQTEAIRILEKLNYVWQTNCDEREKILFRKFRAGRCVAAIHLHTWIGWDAAFHEEDAVWSRARVADDDEFVIVPSPEDAILINVSHALYENKRFTLFDLEKVRAHWARAEIDWAYAEGLARRRGWLDGLFLGLAICAHAEEACSGKTSAPPEDRKRWLEQLRRWPYAWSYYKRLTRSGPAQLPFRVSFAFSKLLYYKKIACDSHDGATRRASNLAHTLAWGVKQKSGVNPQPGMLVTLSGLDGAGKTTQSAALSSALETCGITHVKVWSRPGCSPFYRAVLRILPRLNDVCIGKPSGGVRAAPDGKLSRLLWAALNVADLALVYNLAVRRKLLVGNVVVCDRYVTDAEVELSERLPKDDRLARGVLRLLRTVSPKPRVAYLVDVAPQQAATRSADPEDAAHLEQQRRRYLEAGPAARMHVLDGASTTEDISDDIVRGTLRAYFDRFDTWFNGILLSNPEQLNKIARQLRKRRLR